MPKRTDIKKVMVIGSGPIVIGQAAEFDYSGTQACLALKEEGYEVVLVNSNPATIQTDVQIADKVYMEPLTLEYVAKIVRYERPDAIVPGLGGQTGLNLAVQLAKKGVLQECQVEILGTSFQSIEQAEDRELFKKVVEEAGAESARSDIAHSIEEVDKIAEKFGYPLVVRPSFTMGGLGSGIAHDEDELHRIAGAGIHYSPTDEVLIEEGIEGWKEYELELMRDKKDNVVVVCPIENVDPVGVHTGDSITVAPCFTLTDREYQKLRDIGIAIIRGVGVDTGAYQAVQCRLRRPRTFAGAMGLSGLYDMGRFLGSAEDDLVLRSSPLAALHKNGICDKNVLSKAEENSLLLCVGQGGYEGDALADTQALADTLSEVGFPCHLEVWGGDVSHDWYWWGKELNLFAARVFG